MEFLFSVKSVFPGSVNVVDHDLNVRSLDHLGTDSKLHSHPDPSNVASHSQECVNLIRIINVMGEASGRAQNLQQPITSGERLQQQGEQRLYVILDAFKSGEPCVVGILKMGRKKLFVVDRLGKLNDVDALCVLDFYVHESRQRRGFGKRLFDIMLSAEKVSPRELAIDRPSSKFVSFLCKHYDLRDMIPQPNNFAVFPGFLSSSDLGEVTANGRSQSDVNQRHSYAGNTAKIDADVLFRRALKTSSSARPRSLNDISRCLKWGEVREVETENGPESPTARNGSNGEDIVPRNSKVNGLSPLAQDALLAFNKRRSFPAGPRCQSSTSWNLFGVHPPTYGD